MPVCIVKGCSTTHKTKPYHIMLHSFPKEKQLIKRWLQPMPQDFGDLENFVEKIFTSARGNYRMCSLHFTRDAYEKRGYSIFLKKDAIPTVFPEVRGMEDETSSLVQAAATLPPSQGIMEGLFQQDPDGVSPMHYKTKDETSSSKLDRACIAPLPNVQLEEGFDHILCMAPPCSNIKTEDETSNTTLAEELLSIHSAASSSAEQNLEVGIAPSKNSMSLEIHVKTEDESSGGLITTEIKTVNVLSTEQPLEETSPRPQKRKRTCAPRSIKTIGTVTGYFPGQVHKSIQFDRSMGAKHRSFQVRLRPFHNSVGTQCNLVRLPSLQILSQSRTRTTKEFEMPTPDSCTDAQ